MKSIKTFALLGVMAVLLIGIPGLSWGANALIVHDGTPGIEADALANLTTHLTAAAYTVTPSVGVPGGSLAGYKQIWDIRFNNTTPLSASDMTAYTTFLTGGGSLFLMGENAGFATRNNTIVSFIQGLGGPLLTLTTPDNNETVLSPFTGPTPLASVTFLAADGATLPVGFGRYITRDGNNIGAALVFSPGSFAGAATGTLIVVFDVNFLQAGANAGSQVLTDNMIAYLNAPTPLPPSVTSVPTLSEWGMILMAGLMLGSAALMMRRQRRRVQ